MHYVGRLVPSGEVFMNTKTDSDKAAPVMIVAGRGKQQLACVYMDAAQHDGWGLDALFDVHASAQHTCTTTCKDTLPPQYSAPALNGQNPIGLIMPQSACCV